MKENKELLTIDDLFQVNDELNKEIQNLFSRMPLAVDENEDYYLQGKEIMEELKDHVLLIEQNHDSITRDLSVNRLLKDLFSDEVIMETENNPRPLIPNSFNDASMHWSSQSDERKREFEIHMDAWKKVNTTLQIDLEVEEFAYMIDWILEYLEEDKSTKVLKHIWSMKCYRGVNKYALAYEVEAFLINLEGDKNKAV